MIDPRSSGYCECGGGRIIRKPGCTHGEWAEPFTCHDECAGWGFQKDGMMWKMEVFFADLFSQKNIFGNKGCLKMVQYLLVWMYKYWFPGFGFHSGPNLQPCQCVVSKSKVQTYLIYFSSNTQQCNTKKEMPTLRLNLTDFDMWIRVKNLCLMTRSLQSGIRIWMIDVADVHSVVRKMHRGFVDFHHL